MAVWKLQRATIVTEELFWYKEDLFAEEGSGGLIVHVLQYLGHAEEDDNESKAYHLLDMKKKTTAFERQISDVNRKLEKLMAVVLGNK